MSSTADLQVKCYHCGEECKEQILVADEKNFCCEGCKLVYEILAENNMCTYYTYNSGPGLSPKNKAFEQQLAYLDDEGVKKQLLQFSDGHTAAITFFIPQMHCSSCIWLLENLSRINDSVIKSRVNFLKKEAYILFKEESLSLRKLTEMLSTIGYEPLINLDDLENKKQKVVDRSQIYRIGVAGFCFGNIMLFSFPEYFSLADSAEAGFSGVFSYLNLALSLPVFFYASQPYFKAAWQGLKQRFFNIDVPIALGILVMFVRSSYEIISKTGAGYMDTMAGLVFFMSVGRYFQNKTYDTLSFERDYKSFFPIAVLVRRNGLETTIPVSSLKAGDRIIVRSEELIPADALLLKGEANIDYSFVTGESVPVNKKAGELIYAGGKQKGAAIELEVIKEVRQSYLTQLWNNDAYHGKNDESKFQLLVNRISHYFTIVIFSVAVLSLAYWLWKGNNLFAWNSFTAVLIIACPCALAISSPFTLGSILRIFGRNNFYLKNYSVIEKLAKADTIVFDKTGTLTQNDKAEVSFSGKINDRELLLINSLIYHSTHPLSRMIFASLASSHRLPVNNFTETPGKGISGDVDGLHVRIGSASFTGTSADKNENNQSKVYVSFDGEFAGYFAVHNAYRSGIEKVVGDLQKSNYRIIVLTGDHEGEKSRLNEVFNNRAELHFHQSPADKLEMVQRLQEEGRYVLMIGDGLNDAGALKQSNVGISISDDINNFSPACDAILDAGKFDWLTRMLRVSKSSRTIILGSFAIALLYNLFGLWFAVRGQMSPVFAAILMPISSITIIAFTTGLSRLVGRLR